MSKEKKQVNKECVQCGRILPLDKCHWYAGWYKNKTSFRTPCKGCIKLRQKKFYNEKIKKDPDIPKDEEGNRVRKPGRFNMPKTREWDE